MSGIITLREATKLDLPLILEQRRLMFIDMGEVASDDEMAGMLSRFQAWALPRMATGEFRTWFAEDGRSEVGGAGLWMKEYLPGLRTNKERIGYILNVYVRPEERSKGVARLLLNAAVSGAVAAGADVIELHASDQGHPLYASMGFAATNEMRLVLG